MADPNYILGGADPRRDNGVVYLNPNLADSPAAHCLVVGVAAYRDPRFNALLDTATHSARAVVDWFLHDPPEGFSNPDCPLGSLAVLLSETHGDAKAEYRGGPVPRADFKNTQKAVWEWVERINSNINNLAFVYVASHGESLLSQTTFLLEDYGTERFNATAGMVQVEQFINALENAWPVSQLLIFDCCRTPMNDALPRDESAGMKLISLNREPNDHGLPRKQCVLCSTTLGDVATGQRGAPTLFTNAFLDALNGVAGDVSAVNWPVRPGALVDKIDHILRLHRLPDEEKPQTPAGRMVGSFDITFPGESDEIPVYVSLEDHTRWPGATITVSREQAQDIIVTGEEDQSPFFVERIPDNADVRVVARNDEGAALGEVTRRIRPPASFIEIPETPPPPPQVRAMPASAPGRKSLGQLKIKVDGPAFAANAVSLEIQRRDDPKAPPQRRMIDFGGKATLDVEPADLVVTIRTPKGDVLPRDIRVEPNQIVTATFKTKKSPNEWLNAAAFSGALPGVSEAPSSRRKGIISRDRASASFRRTRDSEAFGPRQLRESREQSDALLHRRAELSVESSVDAPRIRYKVKGHLGTNLRGRKNSAPSGVALVTAQDDGRYLRLEIKDQIAERFHRSDEQPLDFAEIVLPGWKEMAVLPSIGKEGGWRPHLVVDRQMRQSKAATAVIVEDQQWAGLLGYLGARNMEVGVALLDHGLEEAASRAIYDKVSNPLAAAAGALIAVSAADPETDTRWDPWLNNLADWFPGLPDGAIILARRKLTRARSAEELAEAREWFTKGFQRGVPCYSLSVDWLARGLESLPGKDKTLLRMQKHARALANRVDPGLAFTVVRVDK